MCHFKFKMDAKFNPGAATIPTHGGFLMCGQNAEDRNDVIPVDKNHFFVSASNGITELNFFTIYLPYKRINHTQYFLLLEYTFL